MSVIKFTTTLGQLIGKTREIGNKKNALFTAERLIVAIIDSFVSESAEKSEELKSAENMVEKTLVDLKLSKEILMDYICQERSTSFLDDLYMKKKLNEASEKAAKSNVSEVDTVVLLMCVFDDPSDIIKDLMIFPPKKDFPPLRSDRRVSNLMKEEEKAERELPVEKPQNNKSDSVKSDISALVSDVKRIREELQSSIYGQDNAINVFATGYFQASMLSMIDKSRKRPRATFLFAGPPGVGKTFLAEKAAEALNLPFMRFDMSEYADKEANLEFCGSDKVYKNAKAGNVTSFVAANPNCVLLFDEIEKAHICVIHLFLQMLDAGRLRDNFTDEEVSFSNAIIILTTNAGKQLYEESESGDFSGVSRKVIVNALQKDVKPDTGIPYFPSAICSRFASGNVVMFNHIGAHNLRSIAKKEIERHTTNLEKQTGIKFKIDDRVYTALLFSEGSTADARTIRSRAETFFNDELYELLRLVESEKVKTNIDNIENIRISVDLSNTKADISARFVSGDRTRVLVFADADIVAFCKEQVPEIEFEGVQSVNEAIDIIKSDNIDFVLIDMKCGSSNSTSINLNIEDIDSPARDFFKFLKEQRSSFPIYLIENSRSELTEEEKISFVRQGVRGVLRVEKIRTLLQICCILLLQVCISRRVWQNLQKKISSYLLKLPRQFRKTERMPKSNCLILKWRLLLILKMQKMFSVPYPNPMFILTMSSVQAMQKKSLHILLNISRIRENI